MLGAGLGASVFPLALGLAVVAILAAAWQRSGPLAAIALVVLAGAVAGLRAEVGDRPPTMDLPAGRVRFIGVAVGDPTAGSGGRNVVVVPSHVLVEGAWLPWDGPRILVTGKAPDVAAGEPVTVGGRLRPVSLRTRQGWVGGVLEADDFERLGESANPLFRLGNRLRRRVLGGLSEVSATPQGALISGFLIGDVTSLPESDEEALRAAGLSHFVAVSGSNVALFLAAWWIVSGPLAWRPRRRALIGLVGVALFVVMTRWEPSVLRAAVMAAVVLGARLFGQVVSPGAALSWAVTALVLIDGGLVFEVGFQLSVAATAGILIGIRWWRSRKPRWLWATLGATLSAQAAVAPILLTHFGTLPLLAPLTNLVAAPLVTLATMLGGIGALLGADRMVGLAARVAGIVLAIARSAAEFPQLGPKPTMIGFGLGLLAFVVRPLRPVVLGVVTLFVAVSVAPQGLPDGPTVSFLDVGQGDAALLRGPFGEVILIDGGPDASVLRGHLRRAGIRHIDLLVISHRHADHTTGLVGLGVPVTKVWHPPQLGEASPLDDIVAEQAERGVASGTPAVGTVVQVGSFSLEVLAPLRSYASPNDGSLVVRVTADGVDVLFSGDIEAIAQADLGPLRSYVLKVPHQGAATSSLDWIEASAPAIAVISVGPNDFGHPSPEVIDVLDAAGAVVYRTDRNGTVSLRLDKLARSLVPLPSNG